MIYIIFEQNKNKAQQSFWIKQLIFKTYLRLHESNHCCLFHYPCFFETTRIFHGGCGYTHILQLLIYSLILIYKLLLNVY